jgi:hypothetical protein
MDGHQQIGGYSGEQIRIDQSLDYVEAISWDSSLSMLRLIEPIADCEQIKTAGPCSDPAV